MMKKLLILTLVLGMASMANAVIVDAGLRPSGTIDVPVDTTLTITVTAGLDGNWIGYVILQEGGVGALSNPGILPNAGDMASARPYTEPGLGTGYELTALMSPGMGGQALAGDQFTVDFSSSVEGTATVVLWDDNPVYEPDHFLDINVVPEPVTIALLGLGGLFLLRRRK